MVVKMKGIRTNQNVTEVQHRKDQIPAKFGGNWIKYECTSFENAQSGPEAKPGCGTHLAGWIEMNFGGERLFGDMKILAKFQLNWKYQNCTSFTELKFGQQINGIIGRNGLHEMM